MHVGGCDIEFDNVVGTHAGDVFGVIKSIWPLARFENHGDDASKSDADRDAVEFFVYRNFVTSWAINKVGVEDYLRDDFIHVILRNDSNYAAIIVSRLNEENRKLLRLLENKLGWKKRKHCKAVL